MTATVPGSRTQHKPPGSFTSTRDGARRSGATDAAQEAPFHYKNTFPFSNVGPVTKGAPSLQARVPVSPGLRLFTCKMGVTTTTSQNFREVFLAESGRGEPLAQCVAWEVFSKGSASPLQGKGDGAPAVRALQFLPRPPPSPAKPRRTSDPNLGAGSA